MNEHLINTDQLALVLNKYSLGELELPIERLKSGWTNLTFKLNTKLDGKNYILRKYLPGKLRKRSFENIKVELDFIIHLYNELHLPVVPMIDPPGIFMLDDEFYCVLFPFINGVKYLNTIETPVRQFWQILEISRFLGQIHSNIQTKRFEIISSDRRTFNFIHVKYQLVHSCEQFKIEYPDLYVRIRIITDHYTNMIPLTNHKDEQNILQKQLFEYLPVGYIHTDLHDDNVLFSSNERKIVAVLDFDDMYVGPLLIDLAVTLCLWCTIGLDFNFPYAKEFLISYQNARNMLLTNHEWNLLKLFCYLTILNQILLAIEAGQTIKPMRNMINELLAPIEFIATEDNLFLEKVQSIK